MQLYSGMAQAWRLFIGAFVVLAPWFCIPDAHAAILTVNTKTTASSKAKPPLVEHTLRLTSMLKLGDADKLRSTLMRLAIPDTAGPSVATSTIELSSKGGDLVEGFKIGSVLKKFKVVAVVRKGDICLSACALAFLGGAAGNVRSTSSRNCNLEIGGKVAFHNFSLNRKGLRELTTGHLEEWACQRPAVHGTGRFVGSARLVWRHQCFFAS